MSRKGDRRGKRQSDTAAIESPIAALNEKSVDQLAADLDAVFARAMADDSIDTDTLFADAELPRKLLFFKLAEELSEKPVEVLAIRLARKLVHERMRENVDKAIAAYRVDELRDLWIARLESKLHAATIETAKDTGRRGGGSKRAAKSKEIREYAIFLASNWKYTSKNQAAIHIVEPIREMANLLNYPVGERLVRTIADEWLPKGMYKTTKKSTPRTR